MGKTYDIVAKVGEYTNAQGETKTKYQNVGAIIENDNGPYMILERWFNPNGVSNPDNRSSVILSLFKPRDRNDAPSDRNDPASTQYNKADPNQVNKPWENKPAPAGNGTNFEDDIPF